MKSRTFSLNSKVLTFCGHDDHYLDDLVENGENVLEAFAKTQVPKNATILDIGANIGFVSSIFSIHNPDATIYSLEPGLENYNYLNKNIEFNELNNVIPLNIAASNENSVGSFHEFSAWGYLSSPDNNSSGSNLVKVQTIDSLVEELGLKKIDLIKIDVEGFESQVFEGMRGTLSNFNPKVIFEFNSFCMLAYGRRNPLQFLDFIDKSFRHIFRFSQEKNNESLFEPVDRTNFGVQSLHINIVRNASVDNFLAFN